MPISHHKMLNHTKTLALVISIFNSFKLPPPFRNFIHWPYPCQWDPCFLEFSVTKNYHIKWYFILTSFVVLLVSHAINMVYFIISSSSSFQIAMSTYLVSAFITATFCAVFSRCYTHEFVELLNELLSFEMRHIQSVSTRLPLKITGSREVKFVILFCGLGIRFFLLVYPVAAAVAPKMAFCPWATLISVWELQVDSELLTFNGNFYSALGFRIMIFMSCAPLAFCACSFAVTFFLVHFLLVIFCLKGTLDVFRWYD